MALRNFKPVLLVIVVFSTIECCPDDFFRVNKTICLHIGRPDIDTQENYCSNKKSKLYGRPLTEEYKTAIAKEMIEETEGYLPPMCYLGMQNKAAKDAWAGSSGGSTLWIFEGEESEFEQSDYGLWAEEPEPQNYCAAVGRTTQFRALAVDCNEQISVVCERLEEPCVTENSYYASYDGRCLAVGLDKKAYAFAKDACSEGRLIHLKQESDLARLFQAYYNTVYAGGIYIGLRKESDERWVYLNGEEETDGWGPDENNTYECGVARLVSDQKIQLYSMPCNENKLRYLCELISKEG